MGCRVSRRQAHPPARTAAESDPIDFRFIAEAVRAAVSRVIRQGVGAPDHAAPVPDLLTGSRSPRWAPTRRPKYEQVADDLRANITNGTYPVGAALPSVVALTASYRVSVTVARAAIKQLQTEGLVEDQPGRGVYVIREPNPVQPSAEFDEITRQIDDLRDTLAAAVTRLDARLTELEKSLRR